MRSTGDAERGPHFRQQPSPIAEWGRRVIEGDADKWGASAAGPVDRIYYPHIYRDPLWCYPTAPQIASNKIIIEIGPGRGDFLFHLACENPEALVCGIELMHERFEKLMRRRDCQQLENIWLIQGDARRVLPEVFMEGVHEIHIHFSDPWPKRKHHKNRLMQLPFIAACAKTLRPGGYLYFTTDWPEYSDWAARLMAKVCHLEAGRNSAEGSQVSDSSAAPQNDKWFFSAYEPAVQLNRTDVFPSYFYRKWITQGRQIHCQKYRRVA